jgi:hypothetical protein
MTPLAKARQDTAVLEAQRALWNVVMERFHMLEGDCDLRQADLARLLGLSRPQIHAWLSIPENMTIKAAGRLLLAMDAYLVCDARTTMRRAESSWHTL